MAGGATEGRSLARAQAMGWHRPVGERWGGWQRGCCCCAPPPVDGRSSARRARAHYSRHRARQRAASVADAAHLAVGGFGQHRLEEDRLDPAVIAPRLHHVVHLQPHDPAVGRLRRHRPHALERDPRLDAAVGLVGAGLAAVVHAAEALPLLAPDLYQLRLRDAARLAARVRRHRHLDATYLANLVGGRERRLLWRAHAAAARSRTRVPPLVLAFGARTRRRLAA